MKTIDDNKREEIISRMMNNQENITGEDAQLILNDEELKDLYNAAVLCKSAVVEGNIQIPDVEDELMKFKASRKKVMPRVGWWRIVSRVAAIFAGVAVSSLVVVAMVYPHAIDFIFNGVDSTLEEDVAMVESVGVAPIAGVVEKTLVNECELIYDNVSLEKIITELSDIYNVRAEFKSEKVQELRLYLKIEEGKTLNEVLETLNAFEQFSVTLSGDVLVIE